MSYTATSLEEVTTGSTFLLNLPRGQRKKSLKAIGSRERICAGRSCLHGHGDNLLVVRVDLPGIKKEDVQVAVGDGDVVVRGESKTEAEVNKEDYYRLERATGQFYRRLTLPFDAKAAFTSSLAVRIQFRFG